MELHACGAQSAPIEYIRKTQQQCLFTKILSELLKIIHRPCCERFHAGTYFLFLFSRLMLMIVRDVNINGVFLG